LIKKAKGLWDKLSSQKTSGLSVKTGRVTPEYVEILFREIIGTMAALLELREKYFSW